MVVLAEILKRPEGKVYHLASLTVRWSKLTAEVTGLSRLHQGRSQTSNGTLILAEPWVLQSISASAPLDGLSGF